MNEKNKEKEDRIPLWLGITLWIGIIIFLIFIIGEIFQIDYSISQNEIEFITNLFITNLIIKYIFPILTIIFFIIIIIQLHKIIKELKNLNKK